MLREVWRGGGGRGGRESLVILGTGINLEGNYNFPALAYMDLHVQQFTAQFSQSMLSLLSNPSHREKDGGVGDRAGHGLINNIDTKAK